MNYEDIKPYITSGLISEQSHPDDPDVRIFNYTQRCQFTREWNAITMACRGLIMNVKTGEILARPFQKFFNYEEFLLTSKPIPSEIPVITKKYDGSLGIMYTLGGKTWIATRGSFTSEQSVWATKWWRENKGDEPYGNKITHLFEIIYPENRIVVKYNFSGLIHITSIETETGKVLPDEIMPVHKVETVPHSCLLALSKMNTENEEGFVVYYPKADLRLKIKFPEYVRLHKLVTGFSSKSIWECLSQGQSLDGVLEAVPDEFYKWVREVEKDLRAKFAHLWGEAMFAHQLIHNMPTRKEQALVIREKYQQFSAIIFTLIDGEEKKAVQIVWKMIRPKYQQPFKQDE